MNYSFEGRFRVRKKQRATLIFGEPIKYQIFVYVAIESHWRMRSPQQIALHVKLLHGLRR